jgi:serine O-acetyltransferase
MEGLRGGTGKGDRSRALPPPKAVEERAAEVAERFIQRLPELRRLLSLDVQAAYEGDPAAIHPDETIFCYPGIDAVFAHRVAHEFYAQGVPLLPRIIQEMAHSRTGIDINPGAKIGESFFIDHGGAVVIGETTVIGDQVRVYQGVTLGAKSIEKDAHGRVVKGMKRHPTIGDRVTIYAGAVILGGDTAIGDDCIIGGGVFVTESVPAGHVVRPRDPELILRANAKGKNPRVQPEI